jgi:RNA polymerase sigma factor (sigma-70 family)
VEVSALTHAGVAGTHGRSPLLRLQSDERLVALVRRGNHAAFEALVARYQARLLAFCRHMLSSREDAEDVLQEVFTAAYNAILADSREINVRPWLYRIARNRSLNHLRKAQPIGVDSMDVHLSEHGLTTADKVHRREDFRQLMADVQELPESQRTALLLREIDALSYEQIAEAMETTVPSVKSLLVRARVGLAEAAEARLITCEDARVELGEVAEGLRRTTAPVRRHLRSCDRCQLFRRQLRQTNRALAAIFPVGPLLLLKKALLAHAGGAAAGSGGAAAAGTGAAAGGALRAGAGALASKAVAGLAAAAIVTAGAVEVRHVKDRPGARAAAAQAAVAAPAAAPAAESAEPVPVSSRPQPLSEPEPSRLDRRRVRSKRAEPVEPEGDAPAAAASAAGAAHPAAALPVPGAAAPAAAPVLEQHDGDTVVLPATPVTGAAPAPTGAASQPAVPAPQPPAPPPAATPVEEPAPATEPAPITEPAPVPEPTPVPEPPAAADTTAVPDTIPAP